MNRPVPSSFSGVNVPRPADPSGARSSQIFQLISESEAAQNEPRRALEICQRALALAEEGGVGFQGHQARALKQRGVVYSLLSDHDAALSDFARALTIFENLDDRTYCAVLYNLISAIYVGEELYPEALHGFLRAEEIARQGGELRWQADILNNLGYTYVMLAQPQEGLTYLRQSVQIARDNALDACLVSSLDSLGMAYFKLGDLDEAYAYIQDGIAFARSTRNAFALSTNLQSAAMLHMARGELSMALTCLEESLEIARGSGYRGREVEVRWKLGIVEARQGHTASAIAHLEQALAAALAAFMRPVATACCLELAAIYKRQGQFEQALSYQEQFSAAREETSAYQTELRLRNLAILKQVERARKESGVIGLQNKALQREVEERIKAQAVAEHLAITDVMTGLFNRRHFFDLARREIVRAVRYATPMVLVLLDIDHFKNVNATYGHAAGDELLMLEAGLIRASLREADVVGRYSGEEFIILLPETDLESARLAAERLRDAIAVQRLETEMGPVSVTIGIGIAGSNQARPGEELTLDLMLAWADQALAHAKKAGHNRIAVYHPAHLAG